MRALAAALPVVVVLVLMVAVGWSAARAGPVGLAVAVAVAAIAFDPAAGDPTRDAVAGIAAETGFIALTILGILGPALGIHFLQDATGATDTLRRALGELTTDPRVAGLAVAWFFGLLLEGAAGFGTPVALAAPFLVAAGFRPLAAVVAALVGHASGVAFGAIGTPIAAQAAIAGVPAVDLGVAASRYHLVAVGGLALVVAGVLARGSPDPRRPAWGWALVAAGCFALPYGLVAAVVGPELPTLVGAVVGGAAFAALVRIWAPARAGPPGTDAAGAGHRGAGEVLRAGAPYLVVVGLVLATRLVGPLDTVTQSWTWTWELAGRFTGSIQPLRHPAVLLAVAWIVGGTVQGARWAARRDAAVTATARLVPVAIALVAMVGIARTMVHAGMTEELAAAATGTGGAWPLLAAVVGALGTFVTGSATASNVLFTDLQTSTATSLDLDVTSLLGAQSFGAAMGNIVCPHNVVAAAATAGIAGEEGAVLRRTLPVTLGALAVAALLAWWWSGA